MAHRPNTVRFLASSALSLLGNSVASVVLPLVLLARTGDALAAGTLALVCAVPQMLAGLLGGALLDRLNRRNVSIVSDFVSAASIALMPVVDMVWGLSFGWFVVLGLLGAVGDIPGMTARDTLLPAVTKRDGVDLQQFLGVSQSLDSLVTIIGPALAAFLIGFGGDINALWVTAALSCSAALVTATLPRDVGAVSAGERTAASPEIAANGEAGAAVGDNTSPLRSVVAAARASLSDGVRVLFKDDAVLRASTLLTFGIVMVMGSFQGLVLPMHFTETGRPEQLGYVLSALSAGMLAGSLGYAALAPRARKRAWYVASLAGMAAGVAVMGTLTSFPALIAGAVVLGITAGPASALLGFFAYDRIPAERRGSALGTQNALLLAAAPVAMFATSVVVSAAGTAVAALVLVVAWMLVTLGALVVKSMRKLDFLDECEPAVAADLAQGPDAS
ncbi:MFS transporter [Gordonibacter sp. 28C]|uniref:MFS transporter n=1 Tax=Gordonibacter sp. 28C TaxID=2078569 RepID=UPI000DF78086|nr:MFS transporter [Gordonibacter sp. 28C]RDB61535.1 MFS transporter [Gordonibacter sp. 28C]